MSLKTAILSTTSLIFLASGASADVTAKDIWTDWQGYMAGFGYAVTGQETMSGDTLSVSELKMSVPIPDGSGDFALNLSKVDFVEMGDGTVKLVFPETMPIAFNAKGPDGEAVNGALTYTMTNMSMLASGDPSKVTYDYSADQIAIQLNELTVQGEALTDEALKFDFAADGLSGRSVMEIGELRKIVQDMSLGNTLYNITLKEPGGSDGFTLSSNIASMVLTGDSTLPDKMDPENMAAAMADGFAVGGSIGYSDAKTIFAFTDGRDTMNGSSSAETAQIGVRMSKDLLEYTVANKGVNFNVEGAEIPLPIVAGFGEIAMNLLIPVSKSDEPSDFALGVTLGDFVTSDLLWSMFDAGNVLPRDPATVSFDLVGKAKMLFDFFDPEQMAEMEQGEAMPAELQAITLRDLLVSAAGAQLSGTGDFTFDNTDLDSFGGLPKPTGGIDVKLVGGNGLMDKLVQMGLLPQEQAMGARMMLGLFARPGAGEDELTSKVEINEQGHILANGQRIQ